MAPASLEASENGFEIQTRFFVVLECLWTPFGTCFEAFWASWEPFGLPLDAFWQLLEAFRSAENLPRFRRELAEVQPRVCRDSPRFRRELAEFLPRVCRDSAKNPPYEPQANLPFHIATSSNGLRSPINTSTKSPGIKVGRRSPPLGVFD